MNITNATAENQVEFGKFSGRYAYCSQAVYDFLTKQYDLLPPVAHRIANQVACDFGFAMKLERAVSEAKHQVGKASKEGQVTLREALTTTVKNYGQTDALRIAHAVQWLGDAGSHYVSFGYTQWKFDAKVESYIAEITERVSKSANEVAPAI
jgi:hypothetical protein